MYLNISWKNDVLHCDIDSYLSSSISSHDSELSGLIIILILKSDILLFSSTWAVVLSLCFLITLHSAWFNSEQCDSSSACPHSFYLFLSLVCDVLLCSQQHSSFLSSLTTLSLSKVIVYCLNHQKKNLLVFSHSSASLFPNIPPETVSGGIYLIH
jgi:hypothetical protein